jgi:acyl-coenzyme A thioesterase PaaI-like protein
MKKRIVIMNHPWLFKIIMNSWPPYLGAGIYVEAISPEWQRISVAMKLRWYNRNYVNSHFGGNLFSMTDPFYMLMLLRNLGNDYIVWDTSARIKFLKPGRSNVSAHFELEKTRMEEIREKAATGETILERFHVDVVDESGGRIATVAKTLYIKKKVRTQKEGMYEH